MPLRLSVEKRSGPVLVLLSRQHKALVPLLSIALLVCGLALPATIGVLCLVLLACFVGWLTFLSWPAIVGQARAVRLAVVALLVVVIVERIVS
jgi:hypothetical protein